MNQIAQTQWLLFTLISHFGAVILVEFANAQLSATERLPALQTQFENRVNADAEEPFRNGLAELNGKYAQALNQAFLDAQKAGNLDETLRVKEELQRLSKGEPLLKEDPAGMSENLKRLRTAYRQSHDLLATRRDDALTKLRQIFLAELEKMVAELTQQGKLEDAIAIRERIKALGLTAVPAVVPAPAPATSGAGITDIRRATREQPFVNGLAMRFVPVPDTAVLFCIHETRNTDYAAYAGATPDAATTWKTMAAPAPPNGTVDAHPVVGVSHTHAVDFCRWLSQKEGKTYRLPTDREWSIAVGIGKKEKWEKGAAPASLAGQVTDEYPWDGKYPPKSRERAGNFADVSYAKNAPNQSIIQEYDDGFPFTAPVMSFEANKFGLYDMGGNVWEWVDDWHTAAAQKRTLRGGSWVNQGATTLLSSNRDSRVPSDCGNNHGFRIVVELPK